MSQKTIQANTVSALQSHRLISKTIKVEVGHLNIIIGEHIATLGYNDEITIPAGTLYAIANLSPSNTTIAETIELPTFADDAIVYADSTGCIHARNPAPATQSTLSLYMSVLDMRIAEPMRIAA